MAAWKLTRQTPATATPPLGLLRLVARESSQQWRAPPVKKSTKAAQSVHRIRDVACTVKRAGNIGIGAQQWSNTAVDGGDAYRSRRRQDSHIATRELGAVDSCRWATALVVASWGVLSVLAPERLAAIAVARYRNKRTNYAWRRVSH